MLAVECGDARRAFAAVLWYLGTFARASTGLDAEDSFPLVCGKWMSNGADITAQVLRDPRVRLGQIRTIQQRVWVAQLFRYCHGRPRGASDQVFARLFRTARVANQSRLRTCFRKLI